MPMRNCGEAQWEERRQIIKQEKRTEEGRGGWRRKRGAGCQLIRRLICLDFRPLAALVEEGWLEQDGKVCDKRNSSYFIVPLWHTTSESLKHGATSVKQDGFYKEKRGSAEKVDARKCNFSAVFIIHKNVLKRILYLKYRHILVFYSRLLVTEV